LFGERGCILTTEPEGQHGGEPLRAKRSRRKRRSVTVSTVAKAAGVSRAAVSFAYNAPEQISADTRSRILQVAETLGYSPDPIARLLNTRHTDAVGLLMVEPIEAAFADPFTTAFVRGMGRMCDQHGLALTLLPPRLGSSVRTIQTAIVDGIITLGLTPESPFLSALKRRHLPLVVVDGAPSTTWHSVLVDDEGGAYAAAAHLAALGHRHVAIIAFDSPPEDPHRYSRDVTYVTAQRLAGYHRGLAIAGERTEIEQIESHSDIASGQAAMSQLLERAGTTPTAVLAMSDAIALGAMRACDQHGLRVPNDISIIGFDNIPEAALATPPLTTVSQPIAEKATRAMRLMLQLMESPDPLPFEQIMLPTTLIIRESTAPPKGDLRHAGK